MESLVMKLTKCWMSPSLLDTSLSIVGFLIMDLVICLAWSVKRGTVGSWITKVRLKTTTSHSCEIWDNCLDGALQGAAASSNQIPYPLHFTIRGPKIESAQYLDLIIKHFKFGDNLWSSFQVTVFAPRQSENLLHLYVTSATGNNGSGFF